MQIPTLNNISNQIKTSLSWKKLNLKSTAQFPMDLVTFTGEIFNVKIHFMCSGGSHIFVHHDLI